MASYFDHSKPADTKLLHSSVRDHAELENVADQVEYDVINHFREEKGYLNAGLVPADVNDDLTTVVKLRGYAADADAAEANLKEALRRTIAMLVDFSLRNYSNDHGVTAWRRGGRSESYGNGGVPTKDDWPENWDKRLVMYSSEEIVYGL